MILSAGHHPAVGGSTLKVAAKGLQFTSTVVGLDQVLRNLKRGTATLEDHRTPNRAAAVQLYAFVIRNFETEGGETAAGHWKALAPSTILGRFRKSAGKRKRGAAAKAAISGAVIRILQDTGHLRQSFAPFSSESEAGVGARASFGVDYASVHEEGSEDGRIPQRKMLPTEAQALGIGMRVYEFYVERATKQANG